MKKILFMGPMAPPYTGQSIAFTTVVEKFKNDRSKVIDISNKNTILSGIFLCLRIIIVFMTNRFDLIYFTCSRSFAGSIRDVVMLICARIRNIPVINHLHGADLKLFYDNIPQWYRKIIRWVYNGIGESVVLTEAMKMQFIDFPNMKLTVIPNCFSSDLDSCPMEKQSSTRKMQFLYLSNIMKTKGILHLLDAMEIILSKFDHVNFVVAGKPIHDPQCSELEITNQFNEQYKRLKNSFPGRVNYLGVVCGEEKKQLLWDSDVFILPTYHQTEAFPISILEALRTGNYVITTNHRYIPSIVSDENGRMVEPDSTISLFQALADIAEHPEKLLEIQNHNIKCAIEQYHESKYLQSLKKVLDL